VPLIKSGTLNWPWSTKMLGQFVSRMRKNWFRYWKLSDSVTSITFWHHILKKKLKFISWKKTLASNQITRCNRIWLFLSSETIGTDSKKFGFRAELKKNRNRRQNNNNWILPISKAEKKIMSVKTCKTCWDTSDHVCLDLQNCCYSIFNI
jgi:hypothetical protein